MNRPGRRIAVRNWSTNNSGINRGVNDGIAAAGLFAVLAVTHVGVAAQAPVVESQPAYERQSPPLIVPPEASSNRPAQAPGSGLRRDGDARDDGS